MDQGFVIEKSKNDITRVKYNLKTDAKHQKKIIIMGVQLTVIGDHSIAFRNLEIEDKSKLIDLLNSLKLEDSVFIKEAFSKRYPKESEYNLKRNNSWHFIEEDEEMMSPCPYVKVYTLEGPFGLELDINKYFYVFDRWRFDWTTWHVPSDKTARNEWRKIFSKISAILGGHYVMYFPDNLVGGELANYSPDNWCFPDEMEDYFKVQIKDLNHLIEFISENWHKPMTVAEADTQLQEEEIEWQKQEEIERQKEEIEWQEEDIDWQEEDIECQKEENKTPFVIDRFEDLIET